MPLVFDSTSVSEWPGAEEDLDDVGIPVVDLSVPVSCHTFHAREVHVVVDGAIVLNQRAVRLTPADELDRLSCPDDVNRVDVLRLCDVGIGCPSIGCASECAGRRANFKGNGAARADRLVLSAVAAD